MGAVIKSLAVSNGDTGKLLPSLRPLTVQSAKIGVGDVRNSLR